MPSDDTDHDFGPSTGDGRISGAGGGELDEDLPESPQRSARRRTLGYVVGALVVVGLLAAGIARVAAHTSHPTARVSPTVTSSSPSTPSSPSNQSSPSTPSAPSSTNTSTGPVIVNAPPTLAVLRRLGAPEIAAARAECPRLAPTCVTTGETPTTVIGALRTEFPHVTRFVAVSDIAYSDTSGPRLVYRLLSARAGSITLTVEVRQSQSGDGTTSQRVVNGETSVISYQRRDGLLTIEIQAEAPTGSTIDLTLLARITDRPGLLATG